MLAGPIRTFKALGLKMNFMLPTAMRPVSQVLVLTGDLAGTGELVRYFSDGHCLEMSSLLKIQRSRLSNPLPAGERGDCKQGVLFQVTKCDVT